MAKSLEAAKLAMSIINELMEMPETYVCASFDELHEVCDPNMLGNTEMYISNLDVINEAQSIVDETLKKHA